MEVGVATAAAVQVAAALALAAPALVTAAVVHLAPPAAAHAALCVYQYRLMQQQQQYNLHKPGCLQRLHLSKLHAAAFGKPGSLIAVQHSIALQCSTMDSMLSFK